MNLSMALVTMIIFNMCAKSFHFLVSFPFFGDLIFCYRCLYPHCLGFITGYFYFIWLIISESIAVLSFLASLLVVQRKVIDFQSLLLHFTTFLSFPFPKFVFVCCFSFWAFSLVSEFFFHFAFPYTFLAFLSMMWIQLIFLC